MKFKELEKWKAVCHISKKRVIVAGDARFLFGLCC